MGAARAASTLWVSAGRLDRRTLHGEQGVDAVCPDESFRRRGTTLSSGSSPRDSAEWVMENLAANTGSAMAGARKQRSEVHSWAAHLATPAIHVSTRYVPRIS